MGSLATKLNICQSIPIGATSAAHIKSEKPTIKILLLGLDNAGKTTTALHLIGESLEDIIPTIGFSNLQMKTYEKYRVVVYDLGGGVRIRGIWKNYFALIHGIIFVIDSSDISRVLEVKDVIEEVVSNDKIGGKPILVLINKQDIEGALEELDICQYLKLETLINKFKCPTKVETCSASRRPVNGSKIDPSIDSGYQWLLSFISKNWIQLNTRVDMDSNEQFSIEKKSLEERVNRFREKRFESKTDSDFSNENEFIKNGDPFKAIEDVIKNVDKTNANNNQKFESFENNKNVLNGDKESIFNSTSDGEDNYSQTPDSNDDSNDMLTNISVSNEKISPPDKTSGALTSAIDFKTTDAEIHRNHTQVIEEVITKSDAKNTMDLETCKPLGAKSSPESSQKSITSNRSQHKKSKRKLKAMRSSKVSPDLSQNS